MLAWSELGIALSATTGKAGERYRAVGGTLTSARVSEQSTSDSVANSHDVASSSADLLRTGQPHLIPD